MNVHNTDFEMEEALSAFSDLGLNEGDILTHNQAWSLVGLVEPQPDTPWHVARESTRLKMERFYPLRDEILVRYNIDLISVRSEGYKIVPAGEQVGLAMCETRRKVQKALGRGVKRVTHVKRDKLTDDQRREQSDALTRLDQQRAAMRRPRGDQWDW